jgi:glycerophosphoryl diester phosphodiesterase
MLTRRLFASALAVLTGGTVAVVLLQPHAATAERRGQAPVVIGHRGASAHRPEHTLLSYEAAIAMGADYIEPDLVSTKDHILVARHENDITGTTDVAAHPEFADRRTTKTVDGRPITGWFTEDFTLAELKTLRAKERVPDLRPDNTAFDGVAEIPTFEEVVRLAQRHGVGVYPETKHPTYFDSIGLSLEEPLLDILNANHVRKVYIQSFETANLRELRKKTRLPLIQLITFGGAPYDWVAAGDQRTYDDMVKPEGLRGHPPRRAGGCGRQAGGAHHARRGRPPQAAGRARLDHPQRELPAPPRLPAGQPGQPRLPARHRRRDGLADQAARPGRGRRVLRRPGDGPGRGRAAVAIGGNQAGEQGYLSSRFRILPVAVIGSASRNSTTRGYL